MTKTTTPPRPPGPGTSRSCRRRSAHDYGWLENVVKGIVVVPPDEPVFLEQPAAFASARSRSVPEVREHVIETFNRAVRRPGMFHGDRALGVYLEMLAYLDGDGEGFVWIVDSNQRSVEGSVQDLFPLARRLSSRRRSTARKPSVAGCGSVANFRTPSTHR